MRPLATGVEREREREFRGVCWLKTTKAGGGNFNEEAPATSATGLKRRKRKRERGQPRNRVCR